MKKPSTNDAATGRKLKLARQTLRLLSAAELDVAGGVIGDATDTCYTCRPCVTTRV